jgi:hypothetical protein
MTAAAVTSLLMLCGLACFVCISGPFHRALVPPSSAALLELPLRAKLPESGLNGDSLNGPHRALFSSPLPRPSRLARSDSMEAATVHAAASAVHAVVPSAEFVCNRTTCVSLQPIKADDAPPPQPLMLRQQTSVGTKSVDGVLMSTLRSITPAALGDSRIVRSESSAPLRGVGQMARMALPSLCGHGSCTQGFEELADEAMLSAGLISPGTCRLVYDSSTAGVPDGDDVGERGVSMQSWRQGKMAAARVRSSGAAARPEETGFVLVNDGEEAVIESSGDRALVPGGKRVPIVGSSVGAGDASDMGPRRETATDGGGRRFGTRAQADGDSEEAPVVSVMLPIMRGHAEDRSLLTPLRHLYVVMVQPVRRIQAYECKLAQPMYV